MAVKIKDIAERAGVSMPTVSHVLGTRGYKYPIATRTKILTAAQELGYRPHGSARAMRSGRFGCVALLLSTQPFRSSLFTQFLDGVQDALAEHDLHLVLAKLPDEKLTSDGFVPKFLREWMADGLLINYTHDVPERFIPLIEQNGLPSVWINFKKDNDAVYPDDLASGRKATEYLIGLGHQRITYADYPSSNHYSAADRYAGYAQAMQAANLVPQRLLAIETTVGPEQDALWRHRSALDWSAVCKAHLSSVDRPSAVIGYGASAVEPMLGAALTLGMRVPDELSLVTFDDHVPASIGIPMTTWLVPNYEIGRAAVEMLLLKIENPNQLLSSQILSFGFDRGMTSTPWKL